MSPLATLLYCDHGFPVGGDCWLCWQRRALDAEATLESLRECVRTWGASHNELIAEVCGDGPWVSDTTKHYEATIAELREELAQARNAAANAH